MSDEWQQLVRRAQRRRQQLTRRRFLQASAACLAGTVGSGVLGGVYVYRLEPRWVEFTRAVALVAELPEALEGFTIAQLSDLHARADTDVAALREVVARVNALHPDVVALTGDFVDDAAEALEGGVSEALGALESPHGTYAVLGNRDVWTDPARIAAELGRVGVTVLQDASARIDHGGAGLWLLGLGDSGVSAATGDSIDGFVAIWWERREALERLLNGLPMEEPRVLLLHNPDVNEVFGGLYLDLALCGHTHGGQVRLPLLGAAYVPSCMGDKYVAGFAAGPSSPVYVNRGLGVTGIPARLNCRPEVTMMELHALETWSGA